MAQEARVRIPEDQTPHPVSQKTRDKDGAPSSLEGPPTDGRKVGSRAVEKEKTSDFPFAVSVTDVYEGPLDLLLDLIRKQDIDIYDIPIAKITAQYLTYVERLRELDVNVAADFIYMAAVLIHIKSKMLLPRDPAAKRKVKNCEKIIKIKNKAKLKKKHEVREEEIE